MTAAEIGHFVKEHWLVLWPFLLACWAVPCILAHKIGTNPRAARPRSRAGSSTSSDSWAPATVADSSCGDSGSDGGGSCD